MTIKLEVGEVICRDCKGTGGAPGLICDSCDGVGKMTFIEKVFGVDHDSETAKENRNNWYNYQDIVRYNIFLWEKEKEIVNSNCNKV